jgi:AhpD family alkylhydroperoxidase
MRFIEPVRQDEATGLLAQTYDAVKRYMGGPAVVRNGPFLAHSPDAELLAAFWNVAYQTVLVDGKIPRADKHAIAAIVSKINECPFCVEVHSLLSGLEGEGSDTELLMSGLTQRITDAGRRQLAEWAAATRDPLSETARKPPFTPEEAPEAIGTAVTFHYTDRVVSFFHGSDGIDPGDTPFEVVARLTWAAVEHEREPGSSLVPVTDAQLPEDLGWAASSPHMAAALAGFVATVEAAGEAVLDESERACVTAAIEAWDGSDPPLGTKWIDEALIGLDPGSSQARARLALTAALAPHRVDEATVEAFKRERPHDRELVDAVAWSASRAARRIGSWLGTTEAVHLG